MSDPTQQDPAVVGVPDEVPDEVKPSATGLVAGPVDEDLDVVIADSRDDNRPGIGIGITILGQAP